MNRLSMPSNHSRVVSVKRQITQAMGKMMMMNKEQKKQQAAKKEKKK